jgi:hypothetical protein
MFGAQGAVRGRIEFSSSRFTGAQSHPSGGFPVLWRPFKRESHGPFNSYVMQYPNRTTLNIIDNWCPKNLEPGKYIQKPVRAIGPSIQECWKSSSTFIVPLIHYSIIPGSLR